MLSLLMTAVLGDTDVHLDIIAPEVARRRGVSIILCWGACSGTCTIACGPGAPACSIPCAAVCRAACAASTGCFDGDAKVRMEDGREERVADLNELLMSDGGLWTDRKMPQIHTALHADYAGDAVSVAYEPLLGVDKLMGDFIFNEIVVRTDRQLVALNTTSDHGWVSKSRGDNTTCVKESQAIMAGDQVMVRDSASGGLTWGTVASSRSWPSDHKYMLFTKSGMALVNDIVITVLCEAGHEFANDCRAPVVDLQSRLGMMKRKEADELMALIDNGIQFKVADSVAAALKSSAEYRSQAML